ncbi:hypothetical protein ISCGN_016059 [Ixodes scapularis]
MATDCIILVGPSQDTRLREAGAKVVCCLTRGAPKGPNLPRVQLNHQDALFPGHGFATHSQTWVGLSHFLLKVPPAGKPRPEPAGGVVDELGKGSPELVLSPPFTGAAWAPCCSFGRGALSSEQEREIRSFSLGGDLGEGEGAVVAGLSLDGGAVRVLPPGTGGSCRCPCWGAGALRSAAKISGETWVALDSERGAGPLRTTSAKLPLDTKENRFFASEYDTFSFTLMDSRLREAGAEVVYCLTRGAPKGPNLPRAPLNHQDALFPGHGLATHSQTWVLVWQAKRQFGAFLCRGSKQVCLLIARNAHVARDPAEFDLVS